MVHVCVVPGCSNRSDREKHISFHCLPLKNKSLLRMWIHKIGRKNLPLNNNSRVCSVHFVNSYGRCLRADEYPTVNLPVFTTPVRKRRSPVRRKLPFTESIHVDTSSTVVGIDTPTPYVHTSVQTDMDSRTVQSQEAERENLKDRITVLEQQLASSAFRLSKIANDPQKVLFYTGFPDYATLKICYDYLGPAVNCLNYWGSSTSQDKTTSGRTRLLTPLDEFFLVLVRLRLGLFERDLADRFGVSVSTVSRICITWINFLYLKLKEIPMWPKKELVVSCMPTCFKQLYPTTRVIIDATEIPIETPSLPELQQMTYSAYKNHNTYKALIGISPGGAITFVSKLFPGSISDKELTRKSGILDLLESGDSVMADRGFDIQDDLTPLGVKVNIPPFLRGKKQLDEDERIETRRIASLRIHVERAMERIKNFHIFDRVLPLSLTDVSEQMFFVCAALSNFLPPLCN